MIYGIKKTEEGFSVYDFESGRALSDMGHPQYPGYAAALDACRHNAFHPSFYPYLVKAGQIDDPDADTWENMVYAEDPRGIWDNERGQWRNVTSMDRGAATDEEIAYVDALDATYQSLMAMSGR
jgi:hypothetical protein